MSEAADREEVWKDFLDLWERLLAETNRSGAVVVVEGERDRRSLRHLGVHGPIALVHRGAPLSSVAGALVARGRRVIVLTDWDGAGGRFAQRFREFLAAERIEFDLEFRRRLAHALRSEVVHVEGLAGWARRMAERQGTPLDEVVRSLRLSAEPSAVEPGRRGVTG